MRRVDAANSAAHVGRWRGKSVFSVREMTLQDYDKVIALWKQTEGVGIGSSDSRENVAAYLNRNPGMSFVAVTGDILVGAVLCGHDGRRGYLHHLAVCQEYRNRGIGRSLVAACLGALATNHISKCNIFLFRDNEAGKSFWESVGWISRNDLLVMQKVTKKGSSA